MELRSNRGTPPAIGPARGARASRRPWAGLGEVPEFGFASCARGGGHRLEDQCPVARIAPDQHFVDLVPTSGGDLTVVESTDAA